MRVLPVLLVSICIYIVDAEESRSHLIARHRHLRSRQSGELSIRELVQKRHLTQTELSKNESSEDVSRQYPKRRISTNDTFCSEPIPDMQRQENTIMDLVE